MVDIILKSAEAKYEKSLPLWHTFSKLFCYYFGRFREEQTNLFILVALFFTNPAVVWGKWMPTIDENPSWPKD